MANHPILSNTPIREIIFTISYSEAVDIDKLKLFIQQEDVSKKFTSVRDGFNSQLITAEGQKPLASIHNDGYILKCEAEQKVVQARIGSFSLHKMIYEDFESLLTELLRLWDLLLNCIGSKLSINNISVRYLNIIEFEDDEEIGDLITIKPSRPFTEQLDSSFTQFKFYDKKHSDVEVNVIIATPVKAELQKGLLLDIILNQKQKNINDYDLIRRDFSTMRGIKNDVFFKSITGYAVKKYQ